MMPAVTVPPEFVDVTVAPKRLADRSVDRRLGALAREYVTAQIPECQKWRTGRGGQIVMMPAVAVPPEYVDATSQARRVKDMFRTLRKERVTRQIAKTAWRTGRGGQIVMMPAVTVPPEFVDVTVAHRRFGH